VEHQRAFAEEAAVLRGRLAEALAPLAEPAEP
jgi:hypothetical protein